MQLRPIKFSILFGLVALIASVAQLGLAQPSADGFTDHSLISRFTYSTIIEKDLQRDTNYLLVLGGLERVRGDVIPEDSQRLRGDVTTITYEVSQDFRGEDVYEFFLDQVEERNYEVLFSCGGRGCGSSNYWANDIFRNRILYGPESNQYYMAFRDNANLENDPYFALYIITRVNRKLYAHVQIVEPGGTREPLQMPAADGSQPTAPEQAPTADSLLGRLRQQGSAILPPIAFQSGDRLPSSLDLEPILSALNTDESIEIYLVAHLSADGQSLEQLMRRSTARANALRQALIEAGIEASRIEAAGVGPLAPACAGQACDGRIEMVLR